MTGNDGHVGDGEVLEAVDNPLDQVVRQMLQEKRQAGKGFTLGVMAGEDENGDVDPHNVIVTVTETLPPVDDYVPPSKLRAHVLHDTDSFIAYAQKYGNADESLVFISEDEAVFTIEEVIWEGDRERVCMPFKKTMEFEQWSKILNNPMPHRTLFKSLTLLTHTLEDATILERLRKMKVDVQVVHDSDIQEGDETLGILVKSGKGEDLQKFPKTFEIAVPVMDQDLVDRESWLVAEVRLQIDLPVNQDQSPAFTLLCSEWAVLTRQRIKIEMDAIRDGLEHFTVVMGHPAEMSRRIGRNSMY